MKKKPVIPKLFEKRGTKNTVIDKITSMYPILFLMFIKFKTCYVVLMNK